MKKLILIILTTLLLSSCSNIGLRQLRRAEKLIRKAEMNGAKWHHDTTFVERKTPGETKTDSMKFKLPCGEVSHDTIPVEVVRVDTLVIQGKGFKTKVIRKIDNKGNETIKGETTTPDKTEKIPIAVNNDIQAPRCEQIIKWWYCLAGFIVIAIVFFVLGRLTK